MDRRRFLTVLGVTAASRRAAARSAFAFEALAADEPERNIRKPYGSGYFGSWIEDEFGLPAYDYTCNQISDPKAVSPVNKQVTAATDHTHQVGNDRLVAAVSNYGYVQVRQDEGAPKFLNGYAPELGQFGGGIGYLTDGHAVLCTYYPGNATQFDRVFGMGYFRKKVSNGRYGVDQVIFAPFGDDPLLISQVTIRNTGEKPADLRWVEYWGCQAYQFSFRFWMEGLVQQNEVEAAELRRKFGERFAHQFRALENNSGLLESKRFLGWTAELQESWARLQDSLRANPASILGGPVKDLDNGSAMEDLNPPSTFLVSLDAAADELSTNTKTFFGNGGVLHPAGLMKKLDGDLAAAGPESGLLVGRHLHLLPGESRTLFFAYGYLPKGVALSALIRKYRPGLPGLWPRSCNAWKKDGLSLRVPSEPWVEREVSWSHYYLRSGATFDDFFGEHIVSQGAVYQYGWGMQAAARDPLQYALPLVYSNPELVKEIVRYTLKEVQSDGSIPYGIVGHGRTIPFLLRPSDLELWLLWAVSEYVLGTRDRAFLDETISTYPQAGGGAARGTVRNLLAGRFRYLVDTTGTGPHGLLRILLGDWNDGIVVGLVPPAQYGATRREAESVLNAAMAGYVFDHYAAMLRYIGDGDLAAQAHEKAEAQRKAVRAQWVGRWFRRAWFPTDRGWVGNDGIWLEPQPWAIIGGAATPPQTRVLVKAINELVRRPSPIGAMLLSRSAKTVKLDPGNFANIGVWPSINATLIWALALTDARMAWDEWKKNTFARHAEVYPEVWYGIWSGPDYYNSVLGKYPGQTFFTDTPTRKPGQGSRIYWTDYPVMNMHPHSCPLLGATKLLGVEFTEQGLRLAPTLPFSEYQFRSPLLGLSKTPRGYEGWYKPAAPGNWAVQLRLPEEQRRRFTKVKINGREENVSLAADGTLEFRGLSTLHEPLRWAVS